MLVPSALPWWGWLAVAAVLLFAAVIAYVFDEDSGCGCIFGATLGIGGLLTALLGIVRFVKWTWAG